MRATRWKNVLLGVSSTKNSTNSGITSSSRSKMAKKNDDDFNDDDDGTV